MRRLVLAVLVFAAIGGLALWRLGGPAEGLAAAPSSAVESRELEHFEDVSSMTKGSDLVILGTVSDVSPGRVLGSEDEGGRIQLRSVVVDVEQVLAGNGVKPGESLVLEEEGWDPTSGKGYVVNGVTWSQVDDSGVYFLHLKSDPGPPRYRLISSDGRVTQGPEGLVASGAAGAGPDGGSDSEAPTEGPWSAWGIDSMTLSDLVARIPKQT